jgi:cobalt/nickel transport protein
MIKLPRSFRLEILAIVAIMAFGLIFLYTSSISHNEFVGTDSIAAGKISGSSGSQEEIKPLIPQWVPPSGEIESTLFGIQAAIGGMFIGGVFGYWIGKRKDSL